MFFKLASNFALRIAGFFADQKIFPGNDKGVALCAKRNLLAHGIKINDCFSSYLIIFDFLVRLLR